MARILVIDDRPFVLDALRRVLEAGGHQVATARGGAEGLRLFGERPADVVLCDVFMPGVDGLAVIRALRQGFPGVKVVAMSGGGLDREFDPLAAALGLGAVGALAKPFTLGALLGAVEGALRGGE